MRSSTRRHPGLSEPGPADRTSRSQAGHPRPVKPIPLACPRAGDIQERRTRAAQQRAQRPLPRDCDRASASPERPAPAAAVPMTRPASQWPVIATSRPRNLREGGARRVRIDGCASMKAGSAGRRSRVIGRSAYGRSMNSQPCRIAEASASLVSASTSLDDVPASRKKFSIPAGLKIRSLCPVVSPMLPPE